VLQVVHTFDQMTAQRAHNFEQRQSVVGRDSRQGPALRVIESAHIVGVIVVVGCERSIAPVWYEAAAFAEILVAITEELSVLSLERTLRRRMTMRTLLVLFAFQYVASCVWAQQ
jgi:hypothetical protein